MRRRSRIHTSCSESGVDVHSKLGKMGCFSWIFKSKKKRNRQERKDRKISAKKRENASPREDEIVNLKTTTGGVAFEVELKPAVRRLPPIQHKCVETLHTAEQKALRADLRRAEERIKRGYAAKEDARRRELCLEQKAEQERQFIERARSSLAKKILPDDEEIQANMRSLKKRCKTARTRQKIIAVVAGRGGGTSPSPSVN